MENLGYSFFLEDMVVIKDILIVVRKIAKLRFKLNGMSRIKDWGVPLESAPHFHFPGPPGSIPMLINANLCQSLPLFIVHIVNALWD